MDEIGLRQSIWLTVGLWLFTYLTSLMPVIADGRTGWGDCLAVAAAVSIGLVLSVPLFLLMRAIRVWPLWLRVMDAGVAAAVVAWIHALLDPAIMDALRGAAAGAPRFDIERTIDRFLTYLWIYELYVTAVGLIMSTALAHGRERLLHEAQAAANQAQLAALRFQLNPHFLFNTLNAISSLIVTRRPQDAEETVSRLSEFLRASLGADPQGQVTLAGELDTLHAYLDIERVRFGARLRFEVSSEPGLETARVPSFILQPLVENAVKYAVAPSRRGATIRVSAARDAADGLRLVVEDDGEGLPLRDKTVRTGVGLNNVRRRLNVLYESRAEMVAGPAPKGGFRVELALPLIAGGGAGDGT